jgi:excisionase family DNA binding protein
MPSIKDSLTTSQAARLLSVSPDTVLKWAKAGKIEAFRTLGGHYRILRSAVTNRDSGPEHAANGLDGRVLPEAFQYCWEFMAHGGEVSPECRECITYRSRSKRCYELRDLPGGLGCLRVFCKSTCDECTYYQMTNSVGCNVIILSETDRILKDRAETGQDDLLSIRFADNEYACASLIETFRPDFVVVNCALGERRTNAVCAALFNDTRIPVPRIILASKAKQLRDFCDREVFGWITKPFTTKQLRDCTTGLAEPAGGGLEPVNR